MCVNEKTGVVLVGGNKGEIVIWDSLTNIKLRNNIQSYLWNAHGKSCHTILFNFYGSFFYYKGT